MSVERRVVEVDGTQVTCHLAGLDGEGKNPVVLLPGFGGSTTSDFEFLLPMLARHYRVMGVDLMTPTLGFDGTIELEQLSRQVRAAISNFFPESKPIVIGYSLGALVAMDLAGSFPELEVERLILIAAWLKTSASQKLYSTLWDKLSAEKESLLREFAVFSAASAAFVNDMTPQELQQFQPFGSVNGYGTRVKAQMQLMATTDLTGVADRISAQTLVMSCSQDVIAGRDQGEALVGAIENAAYVELESGHAVLVERPAEVLSHIDGFLSAGRATTSSGQTLEPERPERPEMPERPTKPKMPTTSPASRVMA